MKGLIDSTLREGAQAFGVNYNKKQKETILLAVGKIGIEEIELGIASRSNEDLRHLISFCRHKLPQTAISLWSRCLNDDISYAAELRPDVLSLSIPASDLHIDKKFKKSRGWAVQTLENGIRFAKKAGIAKVSVGLEDATRADELFLEELAGVAYQAGAFRLRIADTVGIATPPQITALVKLLLQATPLDVGVHTHNDFGMGTANAIAALAAGAQWADVSTLGMGERAGCARLEEVAGFLALREGRDYLAKELPKLSRLVAKFAKRPISRNQPLVGSEIFSCETGLHLLGLEKEPRTYEPYQPECVGAVRRLVYGPKIGRQNMLHRLKTMHHSLAKNRVEQAFNQVREKAIKLGRPLSDNEFLAACQE
jgi:homocitrate synthase NifV